LPASALPFEFALLQTAQGCALGKARDKNKNQKHKKPEKGDISNEARKGIFLKSLDEKTAGTRPWGSTLTGATALHPRAKSFEKDHQ
jgi:hypothetical protein